MSESKTHNWKQFTFQKQAGEKIGIKIGGKYDIRQIDANSPLVRTSDKRAPRVGDRLAAVNGKPIEQVEWAGVTSSAGPVVVLFEEQDPPTELRVTVQKKAGEKLGMKVTSTGRIATIYDGSPLLRDTEAGARGVLEGDRVVSVNDTPVDLVAWADLAAAPGPLTILVEPARL